MVEKDLTFMHLGQTAMHVFEQTKIDRTRKYGRNCSILPAWEDAARSVVQEWVRTAVRDALNDRERLMEFALAPLKVGNSLGDSAEGTVAKAIASFVCHVAGIEPGTDHVGKG